MEANAEGEFLVWLEDHCREDATLVMGKPWYRPIDAAEDCAEEIWHHEDWAEKRTFIVEDRFGGLTTVVVHAEAALVFIAEEPND